MSLPASVWFLHEIGKADALLQEHLVLGRFERARRQTCFRQNPPLLVGRPQMTHGFIGRPPDTEAVRRDFEEFVTELESKPSEKVRVLFGFAWGNEIYEHDWLELDLSGAELRSRVAEAEAAGLGKIGGDDLYITLPALGVERQYCHEADIHITAADAKHPYVETERQRWLDRGWRVYPTTDA